MSRLSGNCLKILLIWQRLSDKASITMVRYAEIYIEAPVILSGRIKLPLSIAGCAQLHMRVCRFAVDAVLTPDCIGSKYKNI